MEVTLPFHRKVLRAILPRSQNSKQLIVRGGPPEPFPTELWVLIIKKCSTTKQLAALCRTCWFFRQISHARLYKDITLCSTPRGHSLPRFSRSLVSRPDFGALVHDLNLVIHANPIYNPHILLKQLDGLPNLKSFRAQSIFIDPHICYSLHSHPRLSHVSFSRCRLEVSVYTLASQDFSGSSISDLEIHLPDASPCTLFDDLRWAALAPPSLRSLTVSCPVPGRILSNFRWAEKSSMLQKLSLTFLPISITEFLIDSTGLRYLTLDCPVPQRHPIFSSLPEDALPLLEYYAGPAELCELLLRNRPVHTVGVLRRNKHLFHNDYIKTFTFLYLSSVRIKELKVLADPVGSWLWNVPMTLCHLTFILKKDIFMKCLLALSHLRQLRTIRSVDHHQAENLSEEDLIKVSKTCPSLREVDLRDERWVMVQENVWELFK